MKYQRELYARILSDFDKDMRVMVIFGPRRAGKTTLLRDIQVHYENAFRVRYFTGDDLAVRSGLSRQNAQALRSFIGIDTTLLLIDEAQMIPEIGLTLKLLHDTYAANGGALKIVVTGSSSFALAGQIREPLVGRAWTYFMGTIGVTEYLDSEPWHLGEVRSQLLQYGSYPEVLTAPADDKRKTLLEIVNGYVYKDILLFEGQKNAQFVTRLLQLLAFQIGQEVSINELCVKLERSKTIVEKYLWLLQEAFIIVPIMSFSRNLRNEISKKRKYYFWDVGIRNGLIDSFADMDLRADKGALWENYLIIERLKHDPISSLSKLSQGYFWRTYEGQEIDWIEERDGVCYLYEVKWVNTKSSRASTAFRVFEREYSPAVAQVVSLENALDFVTHRI